MKADVKNLSDRPSEVFLISPLKFPHIWEMMAKQSIHHTKIWMLKGSTHVAQNTYEGGSTMGNVHKEGRWEIPHLFQRDQSQRVCIKRRHDRQLGLRCGMHLWPCFLDHRKLGTFWRECILVLNSCNKTKQNLWLGLPPRTEWEDGVTGC